jgi:predicted nucleic acid-binding protein
VVRDFLKARFPDPASAYDALVAATAAEHSAELVTCDRRAGAIYERYGVRSQLL